MSGHDRVLHDRVTSIEEGDARALAAALRSVAMAETDRRGLMIRPSRLPAGMLRPEHRQRIRAGLEPLLSASRARLFRLPDRTSVVLWRGDAGAYLTQTLAALARAVADLPGGITAAVELITLVELPRDSEILLETIAQSLVPAGVARQGAQRAALSRNDGSEPAGSWPAGPGLAGPKLTRSGLTKSGLPNSGLANSAFANSGPDVSGKDRGRRGPMPQNLLAGNWSAVRPAQPGEHKTVVPLDIGALATLEQALAQADVANLARRKPICATAPGGMRLAWEKRYLSVADLAAILVPDCAPQAEPWLFRRLTRTLDRRMLALLSHPDELELAGPFSLNLNCASILSQHFSRFDAGLPARLRGEIVLDLAPADIMGDLATYVLARDLAHDRGYRLLLRNVTAELVPVLPMAGLGFDLLQLRWSPDLARLAPGVLAEHAARKGRLVLGGADHQDALEWGIDHNVGLFQGMIAQPSAAYGRVPLPTVRRLGARA